MHIPTAEAVRTAAAAAGMAAASAVVAWAVAAPLAEATAVVAAREAPREVMGVDLEAMVAREGAAAAADAAVDRAVCMTRGGQGTGVVSPSERLGHL